MNEQQKLELQELQNLEGNGMLEEVMKVRFEELKTFEQFEKTVEEKTKLAETALAQKEHFREKAEKAELARLSSEEKLKNGGAKTALDVEDYIGISASLDGLDPKEKEYLAQQHKLSGRPLNEIRKDEDFGLWQSAYRAKVEKEKQALKPDGNQMESDKPTSLEEKLANASLADKEKMLTEAGLYLPPKNRGDRTNIGTMR